MHQLLINLPLDRFAVLYEALPAELSAAFDGAVARMLNCRLPSVRRQPPALRAKALRLWIQRQRDDAVAGDLLRAYFLGPRKALVVEFLDSAGVQHEDGQVGPEGQPDDARVADAVQTLLAAHERSDVLLYLQIAQQQWPECAPLTAAVADLGATAAGRA
ncbi:MAG: hypothetical protein ACT4PU_13410 [Planctomycetota bacterium]